MKCWSVGPRPAGEILSTFYNVEIVSAAKVVTRSGTKGITRSGCSSVKCWTLGSYCSEFVTN
jgi:hypothetical protein